MSAQMDKLMMQVALIDKVTKPLKGIQKTVTQTTDAGRVGWEKMAGGTAGVIASGFAIQQALMPAIEMDRVLGEVKSLGVIDEDLQKLQQTALGFSAEYGKSAEEVVSAAYDIKSAFGDISGDQLSDITKSSAVLAAATKSDSATITNYMGTMYGVFKNQANDMGVGIWSKQVAGMTAQSVEMFKTTGDGMSAAFTSVGANATSAGIKMNEQMAILGTLQSTMSGSEAGTKYRSFLAGVGKAQDTLGMKFTDSEGKMLPMLDILNLLKGRFGDTFDVAESLQLDKAFGTKEATAMIKLLMADTQGLASSINTLGEVKGMNKAEKMAGAMTDQWQRLSASWYAIRAGAFGLVLPAINGIIGSMADGFTTLLGWSQEFPVITEYVGYFALAIIGGAGVLASWNLLVGLSTMIGAGWTAVTGGMSTGMTFLKTTLSGAWSAILKFNAALWANPAMLVVAGIVALGAVVVAAIVYWDDLIAAMNKIWIFRKIGEVFQSVWSVVRSTVGQMLSVWNGFVTEITTSVLFQTLMAELVWIQARFSGVFDGLYQMASGTWQLIGASIDWFIAPLQIAFTLVKSFFTLLVDGPEAAMAVLNTIPQIFSNIYQSIGTAFSRISEGFVLFVSSGIDVLSTLAQPFVFLGQQAWSFFDLLVQGWTAVTSFLSNISVFELIGEGINWLIDKINLIPGIEIDSVMNGPNTPTIEQPKGIELPPMPAAPYMMPMPAVQAAGYGYSIQEPEQKRLEKVNQPVSEYLYGNRKAQAPSEGYLTQLSGGGTNDNSRTMHTGDIHIHQEQPFTPEQLSEWNEMDTP